MNATNGSQKRKYTTGHFALFGALLALLGAFAQGCGPADPTCDECLAQQQNALLPPGGGCYPYCEGEEPGPDSDGDGTPDDEDLCPNTPETDNGYQDGDGCPDTAPTMTIPESAEGTWVGDEPIVVNGAVVSTRSETFDVVVNGDMASAVVTGFCPDGSGAVTVRPSPNGIVWSGIYSCPPGPWGACPRANLLFFGISIQMNADGTLTRRSGGSAYVTDNDDRITTGCDASGEFSATVTGHH